MTGFTDPLARWNDRFAIPDYLFGESPNEYLFESKTFLQPGRALSVADGEGRNSVWLAGLGLSVDAFDFSPPAVAKAHTLAAKNHVAVNLQCCDWESFSWPVNHYDNVVGIFFQFVEPQSRAALFAKMAAALKPGGIIVIQGYGKNQLKFNTGGPGRLDNLYDEDLLREAFQGYEMLDLRTEEKTIAEGQAHRGMSALVGLVARKPMI